MQRIKDLTIALNKACSELDRKLNINCGGCCLTAAILANGFDMIGVEYELVVFYDNFDGDIYYNDSEIIQINNDIKSRILTDFPCADETASHYCIYLPEYDIFINKAEYPESYHGSLYLEDIHYEDIMWIYRTGDWNSDYNTSYNEHIREKLISIFIEYEKEKYTSR